MSDTLTQQENFETDIELRMVDLCAQAIDVEEWDLETALIYMRCAYTNGYSNALTEKKRGKLCLKHGYRVPQRGERG
jgi:hypothetical protein